MTTSAYTTTAKAACGALPPPPHVLMRTSSSLTVTAAPWRPPPKRGQLPPVAFAVYAKPFGSGVGASLNSTTYEGSGVAAPLGSVRPLHPVERRNCVLAAGGGRRPPPQAGS